MQVKVLQLHKRPSEIFENIQDKFSVNENLNCFALADGTTQSFRSEIWADLICKEFQNNPIFEARKLIENFKKNAVKFNEYDFQFSDNLAIASLQKTKKKKGGTATFLGLQINNNICKAISCGDTNLFHLKHNSIDYFPYENREEIDKNTSFINTEQIFEENFNLDQIKVNEIIFENNETIILATDALSRLFLADEKFIYEFLNIDNFEEFHNFCLNNWDARILEEDDISAIIIKKNNTNSYTEILPPIGFSFPKIEIRNETVDFKTLQSMKEINDKNEKLQDKVMQLQQSIVLIKKSNKLNLILVIVAILLGLLNLFGFYKNHLGLSELNKYNSQDNQKENKVLKSNKEKKANPISKKYSTIVNKNQEILTDTTELK